MRISLMNESKFTFFLLVTLLFFYTYGINFTFMPTYTSRIIAFFGLIFLFLVAVNKKVIRIDKDMIIIFLVYYIYLAWVTFRTMAYSFHDTSFLTNAILLSLQVFAGSLFIAYILYKKRVLFDDLLKLIVIVTVIQGIFIILSFLSNSFQEFTLTIIPATGNVDPLHDYRVRGLTHGVGAGLAARQSIGVLLIGYLIMKCNNKKEVFVYLVGLAVIVASILFTGRTGFLVLFPFISFFIINFILTRKVSKKLILSIIIGPIFLFISFQLLRLGYQFTGAWATDWGEDGFERLLRWVTSEFNDNDGLGTRTMVFLFDNHWFFPNDNHTLFLGDPTTYALNRIPSDIGIVRRTFGIGLIGLFLSYLLYFTMTYISIKNIKDISQKLIILHMMIWILILELKEPFIYDFRFASLYTIILFYSLMSKKNFEKQHQNIDYEST